MDFAGLKPVKDERNKFLDLLKKPAEIIETNKNTVNKLFSGEIYEKQDIEEEMKTVLKKYKENYDKQFRFAENFEKLDEVLSEFAVEPDKPNIIIYGKPVKRWVSVIIIQQNTEENTVLLYKDPSGDVMPTRLIQKFKEFFSGIEIINNGQMQQDVKDDPSYGPLTLRNIDTILNSWNNNRNNLSKRFSTLQFPLLAELKDSKIAEVIKITEELKNKSLFLEELREFISNIPLDLSEATQEYTTVLGKELEKGEEFLDVNTSRNARHNIKIEDMKKFTKKFKSKEASNYGIDIEEKFPSEIESLNNIFKYLDNVKRDDNFFVVLKNISDNLGINVSTLKLFYESQIKREEPNKELELESESIGDISKTLPEMKQSSCDGCTPLDEVLNEIVIGMDRVNTAALEEDQLESINESLEADDAVEDDKENIKVQFFTIQEHYEDWQDSSIEAIHDWAVKNKGTLDKSEDTVCQTLAIIDRAFNLITGGWRLRIPLIISALLFLKGYRNQGRLCQVQTGEGKTVLLAVVAIVKCLQGHTVDAITSSTILAEEGVEETKKLLAVFGLTTATNNRGNGNIEGVYKVDVLYGAISNFQFDYLRESLDDDPIRRGRKFDVVILDEVDSMLIDNGGHIAKLATPYPGMESLRYIYINIWKELERAEKEYIAETRQGIEEIIENYADPKEAESRYEDYVKDRLAIERTMLKQKLRASKPTEVPFIPQNLQLYVDAQLETWISNAIYAKYNCHEHKHYRLIADEKGEKKIYPVDYLNTGVTMKNTIWSKGLHQFVQLKHRLRLTFETLTSSFISNIGYIKLYNSENTFGMTGTLGSRAEQELLAYIYNVDYAKIPTFKPKMFLELPGMISEDILWANKVAVEILAVLDDGRSVLAIFETEGDLLVVEKKLRILQTENVRIRLYSNEEHASETKQKANVGDVILATNIAGRGTNFKTTKDLEAHGGLHVMVCFLPVNLRVEGQAFGRTSRQGNNGTAQLMIRKSEIDQMGLADLNPTLEQIKYVRDRLEGDRLDKIRDELVRELAFKDELYALFAKVHREERRHKPTEESQHVLKDFKEFWAYWLEMKQYRANNIDKSAYFAFEEFKQAAKANLDGKIHHNPHYAISLADYFIENGDWENADKYVNIALEISHGKNVPGAHMKHFELCIEQANGFYKAIVQVLEDILSLNLGKNDPNLSEARSSLNKAQTDIEAEIEYIDKLLKDPQLTSILYEDDDDDNGLLRHLKSKLYCLQLHSGNIDTLIKDLESGDVNIALESRTQANLKNLLITIENPEDRNLLSDIEITDLQNVSLNAMYSLKIIKSIPTEVRDRSLIIISAGVVALGVGLAFFPSFPFMSGVASTLISEGVMDITMAVVFGVSSEEKFGDYVKGKIFGVAVSLLTFGIGAIVQVGKVIWRVIKVFRKLSRRGIKRGDLKLVAQKTMNSMRELHSNLSHRWTMLKFNNMSRHKQYTVLKKLLKCKKMKELNDLGGLKKLEELKKTRQLKRLGQTKELFQEGIVKIGRETGTKLKESIYDNVIIPTIAKTVTGSLIEKLSELLETSIRSNIILMAKLQKTQYTQIEQTVENFTKQDLNSHMPIVNISYDLYEKKTNKKIVKFVKAAHELTVNNAELLRYLQGFSKYLEKNLKPTDWDNDVDIIVEKICTKLKEKIFDLWCNTLRLNIAMVRSAAKETKQAIKNRKVAEDVLISGLLTLSLTTTHLIQYYAMFNLPEGASLAEVKKKYREYMLVYDSEDEEEKKKMLKLTEIYEFIEKNHPETNG